ncbi:hypothetical protein JNM87_01810 [Candidatus Saccharibacteria bacterium]|nr:hypothetical protein [Candidatus Saccharibacteria bacterium]
MSKSVAKSEAKATEETPIASESNYATTKTTRFSRVKISRLSRNNLLIGIIIILLVGMSFYFYHRSRQAELQLSGDTTAAQVAVTKAVKKVSKHMILPTDEKPTLATVSDVTKVNDQPFFTHAKNGDQVLVYTQTRKAILYRPSVDRVVEVAPLSVNSVQQSAGIKQ